ncbi:MAG: hypothetical protein WCE52_01090 [Candidatus Acidiferrum sp.]
MGLLDSMVSRAFRDERTGRVVVFSGDRRDRGYLIRSASDELKIKSFLKMFYIAYFAILWLGMMVANGCSTFIIHLDGMGRPAAHMLRSMGIALGVYSVVVGLPFIFLWRTYKKAILGFVSAQDEVLVSDSSVKQQRRIVVFVLIGCGFLLLGLAILGLIRAK